MNSSTSKMPLGAALDAEARLRQSLAKYRLAVDRQPASSAAWVRLAHAHLELGEPKDAVFCLESALAIEPTFARAHVSLGIALYQLGNIERAWGEFSWYYREDGGISRRRFERPMWDGSRLDGRRLLVWTDQGVGDTILFLRYLKTVKSYGASIIVECHHPGLFLLIAGMPDVDDVILRGMRRPSYDAHAPLVFLPSLFCQDRSLMPESVPYLRVGATLRAQWRHRLRPSAEKAIGICWSGNMAHPTAHSRFVPLPEFVRIRLPGVRFISLQSRDQNSDDPNVRGLCDVEYFIDESCSVADIAAVIENLDLVITVDTMIPHLAGALGRPVWTLLRHAPSWRYWAGRHVDWFPTMRLFRQTTPGDWLAVFERTREALGVWLSSASGDAASPSPMI